MSSPGEASVCGHGTADAHIDHAYMARMQTEAVHNRAVSRALAEVAHWHLIRPGLCDMSNAKGGSDRGRESQLQRCLLTLQLLELLLA